MHSSSTGADPAGAEGRVRAICLALPGCEERTSHGSPAFFAGRQFVMLWPHGHHDDRFPHLWCAAPPGAQEELTGTEPDRFFRPPYVGHRGWIGVRLDGEVDWDEVATICREAHRVVAPARLLRGACPADRPVGANGERHQEPPAG